MLRLAHEGGCRSLVATPHMFLPPYNVIEPQAVVEAFTRLTAALAEVGRRPEFAFLAEVTLYLGSENYLCTEFLAALETGRLIPLNKSRYLLVEFPRFLAFELAVSAAERILAAGFVPVLAHVERYDYFQKSPRRLAGFAEMGCVSQLDAATLLGARGRHQARFADELLRQDLIHVIASDAHDTHRRRPNLSQAHQHLREAGSAGHARLWMWENPVRILANRDLAGRSVRE